VTGNNATFQQTAWLFTMGTESIYAEVREGQDGFELAVNGPGTAHASYTFPDSEAMDAFRSKHEQELLAKGFRLQAVTERRSGEERRTGTRGGTRDRRR
jgi:hypothetical protein